MRRGHPHHRLHPHLPLLLLATAALASAAALAPPTVLAPAPGPPAATNLLLWGVNQPWAGRYGAHGLAQPERVHALRALGVGSVRFPGGTVSQGFDLRAGRFVPDERIVDVFWNTDNTTGILGSAAAAKLNAPGTLSLANVSAFLAAASSPARDGRRVAPVWDLNVATLTRDELADTVKALAAGGADLRFLEFGNEMYAGAGNASRPYGRLFPRTADYLAKVAPAVAAAEARAAAGAPAGWAALAGPVPLIVGRCEGNDQTVWNDGLFADAATLVKGAYPALTAHFYFPLVNATYADSLAAHPAAAWPTVVAATPEVVLARTARSLRDGPAVARSARLWLTETNMAVDGVERWDPPTPLQAFHMYCHCAPVAALSFAGYLLAAVASGGLVEVLHRHGLWWHAGSVPAAEAKLWSRDPTGMVRSAGRNGRGFGI